MRLLDKHSKEEVLSALELAVIENEKIKEANKGNEKNEYKIHKALAQAFVANICQHGGLVMYPSRSHIEKAAWAILVNGEFTDRGREVTYMIRRFAPALWEKAGATFLQGRNNAYFKNPKYLYDLANKLD